MKRSRTIRRALETLGETLLKENESEEVRNVTKFSLKVPSLSTPSLEMKLVTTSVGLQLDDDVSSSTSFSMSPFEFHSVDHNVLLDL